MAPLRSHTATEGAPILIGSRIIRLKLKGLQSRLQSPNRTTPQAITGRATVTVAAGYKGTAVVAIIKLGLVLLSIQIRTRRPITLRSQLQSL